MDIDVVRAAVAEAFTRTGAATPGWANPHADRAASDDEYSRLLDPGKYRILGARAAAWAEALTALGLARADRSSDGIRLRAVKLDTVPIFLALEPIDGVPDAHLRFCVGEPGLEVSRHPDCGCDACDWGSDDLLEHLDDQIAHVVSGDFVSVDGPEFTAHTTLDGWSSSGLGAASRDIEVLLAEAAAGRSVYPVIRGACWW